MRLRPLARFPSLHAREGPGETRPVATVGLCASRNPHRPAAPTPNPANLGVKSATGYPAFTCNRNQRAAEGRRRRVVGMFPARGLP